MSCSSGCPSHSYLAQAIERCGGDIEAAIAHLTKLQITNVDVAATSQGTGPRSGDVGEDGSTQAAEVQNAAGGVRSRDAADGSTDAAQDQVSGEQWVEIILQEMAAAKDIDDARERARRILQSVEEAILQRSSRTSSSRVAEVERENHILKRAVAIQNGKLKDAVNRETQAQQALQEQSARVRNLELTNYSLALHLKQATGGSDLPANNHPDVF